MNTQGELIGEVPAVTAADIARGRRRNEVLLRAIRAGTSVEAVRLILKAPEILDASTATIELARRLDEHMETCGGAR
ncbi:MAG: hypothetical protein WC273_00370 [Dehalococcoidia bacterium]